jgi:hypothetical protein
MAIVSYGFARQPIGGGGTAVVVGLDPITLLAAPLVVTLVDDTIRITLRSAT